jgi:hypothetical protein
MFVYGLISIFQICVLPGLVILALFDLKKTDRVVLAFPISLLANYVMVNILTLSGLYTRGALIVILIIECLILALYTKYKKGQVLFEEVLSIVQPDWKIPLFFRRLFFLLATIVTFWLVLKIIKMTPSSFSG